MIILRVKLSRELHKLLSVQEIWKHTSVTLLISYIQTTFFGCENSFKNLVYRNT